MLGCRLLAAGIDRRGKPPPADVRAFTNQDGFLDIFPESPPCAGGDTLENLPDMSFGHSKRLETTTRSHERSDGGYRHLVGA